MEKKEENNLLQECERCIEENPNHSQFSTFCAGYNLAKKEMDKLIRAAFDKSNMWRGEAKELAWEEFQKDFNYKPVTNGQENV